RGCRELTIFVLLSIERTISIGTTTSIVASISACHADDPGLIPGLGGSCALQNDRGSEDRHSAGEIDLQQTWRGQRGRLAQVVERLLSMQAGTGIDTQVVHITGRKFRQFKQQSSRL